MLKNNRLTSCLLIIGLLLSWPAQVLAAGRNTAGGVSLSPFEQQISLAPTDIAKSFNLTITNHTASLQELDLTSQDFGSLNDTGGVLLEGSNTYSQKYGLVSWLTLGADMVVLQPNESRDVLVTINNRSSLQPGGHYGAVVASVNSLNDQSGNHVVINQKILSLVLVDKIGGEHYNLSLKNITQNGNWLHLPNDIRLRFQNPGNVHVIPRGLVKLKSPTGKVLAQGVINDESAYILPESFREIYVALKPVGKAAALPGLYHVEVDYRYDGINLYAKKSYAVRYIDLKLYAGLVVIISLAGYLFLRRKKLRRKKSANKN